MEKDSQRIETFADAVDYALGLEETFRQAHAAALTDERGLLLDLIVYSRPTHTEDAALDWALCYVLNDARAARMVLLSVVRRDVRRLRERDIAKIGKAREVFGQHGVDVLDWIQVGKGWIRSLAYTAGLGTWTSDGEPLVRGVPPSP